MSSHGKTPTDTDKASHGQTRTNTDNSLSSRAIDQESRRVIREDLLTNILVEAGAGSGKTQMLAERMAAGVASGVYQVEHMAAVTFTRKAASELRGRFHLALEQRLSRGSRLLDRRSLGEGGQAEEEARVRVALGNLERFFAGTIHSFCARLLRERPVESGVSPGFTELDEVQDEEVRNLAWRDFIAAARSAGDPEMLALLDTGVRPSDLDSAFYTICNNEDVEFPPGDGVCPDPKAGWKALEQFWTKLAKLLPEIIGEDTTCGIQKAARQYRAQLRVAAKRLDRPSTIASLMETWKCDSKITQKAWATSSTEKKRYKDLVETMHADFRAATVDPFLKAWRQYVYRLSVSLLTRAREYAARERRLRNALNYGDLLNLAARVLRENPQVRRALQRKYQNLFVDEFQDTDPVQAEIVFLLAADGRGSLGEQLQPGTGQRSADVLEAGSWKPEANWRQVSLRPGALFVVGDPKQSIYRFRRADIEIYNAVRERFSDPATWRVVPLTMNFRSVPALCDWANTVFVDQFPKEPTPHSPRFQALDSKDDASGTSSGGVFTITHTCDSKDVPAEDAAKIARYIKAEVDAGRRKYSDFLILTRKKKGRIAPYASALEELNIPVEVSGAGAFGESAEVEALTTLLHALSDPQDALPLVAVLRGPFFGISDPELFAFKQAGGWFSIFHGHDSSGTPLAQGFSTAETSAKAVSPAHERVAGALTTLRQYYRWTRILPAGAAIDRILEHTGYLALAATTPGGVEAGDLLHALDRVRQVAEDGGSLGDAADALAADSEASNEVESLPLEPGRTDVVRLMNLHKAKGLEADVVFLADPCGGPKQWVDVHIERRGQQAVGWFKVVRKYTRADGSPGYVLLGEHANWPAHEATERPYLQAEENRLLYVAATRARQLLIVSRQVPQKGTAAWGVVSNALTAAKELTVPATVAATTPKPARCSAEAQAEARATRSTTQDGVTPPSWSITSVTAEAKHIAKMAGDAEPAAVDDATRVVAQDTPSHRADAGMAWGTLIHGLLEHAMRHPQATSGDLKRLGSWLTVEQPYLRSVIDHAVTTVQAVATAAFWPDAQSGEHSVETPFGVARSERALSTGVIDLLYQGSNSEWKVIDYKTDSNLDTAARTAYEAQLEAYRKALAACGLRNVNAGLRHVRSVPEAAQ